MRHRQRRALALTALFAPLAAVASSGCNGDDTDVGGVDAGTDTTAPQKDGAPDTSSSDGANADVADANPLDAMASDAPPADAAPPAASIRVAWFTLPGLPASSSASDAGDAAAAAPTYDVCVAPHGTLAWQGPLLAKAGGTLSVDEVSSYVAVAPGRYDLRLVLVAPGETATCDAAGDSSTPATDFTSLPSLASGAALTAVVTPSYDGTNPLNLAVVPLLDDTSAAAGSVAVRFVDVASPSVAPLSYGLGGGVVFAPWFTNVSATEHLASGDGGLDAFGYVEVPAFLQIDTSIMSGAIDLGSSGALAVAAGDRLSAFAVPAYAADGNGPTAGLVVCFDGQPAIGAPALTKCTPLGVNDPAVAPPTETRFGDLIANPSFPAIDTCIKYVTQAAFTGPLGTPLADAGSAGQSFGDFTARYDIHAGFTYDLRVVAHGSDCSTPLTSDATYSPAVGLASATVVYTGYAGSGDAGPTPPFRAATFRDLACGESLPVVRVANVDAFDDTTLTLSFGTGGSTAWTIASIPYGTASSPTTLDACDYLAVTPASGTLTLGSSAFTYGVTAATADSLYVASGGEVIRCDDTAEGETIGCAPLVAVP